VGRWGRVAWVRAAVVGVVACAGLLGVPAGGSGAAASGSSPTVWLCRPGLVPDPCTTPLTASVVRADGTKTTVHPKDAARPGIDCFYVYPTVSDEKTANADLQIQPAETGVAFAQASRFSQVCRVFAPMYTQVTLAAITGQARLTEAGVQEAYQSALSGFKDYLAHYNHGRGIVFIGHSQGAGILMNLLQREVDPDPKLRTQLVSAILLGGNVAVPIGKSVGATFQHIPACRAARETGCVIAYSSFLTPPPSNSIFGIVGQGVSGLSGQGHEASWQVLCVNPAALTGGLAPITPYFPAGLASAPVPWVTYPGLYEAQCASANGATWLQVDEAPGDPRPVVSQVLGPTWGLHIDDVNLTLGSLVSLVGQQARAYVARHK